MARPTAPTVDDPDAGGGRVPYVRSRVERRFYAWVADDATVPARLVRLGALFTPLGLAVAFSLPVCPSAAAGIPCPGCGLTRATLALMSGDVAAATALQPLAVVVCPLLGGATLYACLRYLFTGRVQADRWHAGPLLIVSMAALTIVWALRWFGFFGGPVAV